MRGVGFQFRLRTRRQRPRRGAEILEAAFVLPIMLSLAFGTVEFGYYFFIEHTMQGAAREGARAGAPAQFGEVPNGPIDQSKRSTLATTAANSVMNTAGLSNYTTDVQFVTVGGQQSLKVTVSGNWNQIGLRPMGIIQSGHVVKGQAVMLAE